MTTTAVGASVDEDDIEIIEEADREPEPVTARARTARAVIRPALAITATILLAFVLFLLVGSRLTAARDQVIRERTVRSELAAGTVPIGGRIDPGTPIAILTVPELGIRQIVAEGTTSTITAGGPGHVRATPMPGQAGNSVLIARRTTFGAPFRNLDRLERGDTIGVVTGQGRARYRVTEVSTAPADDTAVFATTSRRGELTLLTADPPRNASQYLVARARLTSDPVASTPHVRRVEAAETGLTGDGSGIGALALALVLLLAAALGATWLAIRWRPWSAYLVSVPVLVAATWWVFECAAPLLPAAL
jgi:sortase A